MKYDAWNFTCVFLTPFLVFVHWKLKILTLLMELEQALSWLNTHRKIYVCQQTHHSNNEFPEQIDSANFVTIKWGFRPHVESLNIFQYFGQKNSSNTPLPPVLLTNKLLQNERKQFNSPTAFPCVTNCNRNKHNNQDNGGCDDRNENWLGKSLMSRCRCLGHFYMEKNKII